MKTGTMIVLGTAGLGAVVLFALQTKQGQEIKETFLEVTGDVLKTKGYKNNNPLNITRTRSSDWKGMAPVQSDFVFVQFTDPKYGIRAGRVIIENNLAGVANNPATTIRSLVTKWTATEKDRPAYIKNVSEWTGIPPDRKLKTADIFPLIKAMIRQEIGGVPYADSVIRDGMAIA